MADFSSSFPITSHFLKVALLEGIEMTLYRNIPSAVDLKLKFFAESCEEGATSVHYIRKEP